MPAITEDFDLANVSDDPSISGRQMMIMDEFDGLEKAAMLMLVAGEDHTRMIFERLNLDEIKEITQKMSRLGRITSEDVEKLLREFKQVMGAGAGVVGSYDTTKELLSKVLDEDKVALIMKDIGGPAGGNIWEKLSKVDETTLANFLKTEYPQTIAVVLSKLKTDHAARVMSLLPKETTMEAMMRMLRLETVQKEIMIDVEDLLRAEFVLNASGARPPDQHEVLAEIFNHFDRASEATFLGMLEERNKESAELVRALMFTFDDLIKFDGPSIQILLRNVDNAKLGLALKGAKDELKDLFLKNMSERAAKILREDMENMGPVRLRDVEEAQAGIVVSAKQLVDSGEIMLAGDDSEDLIS